MPASRLVVATELILALAAGCAPNTGTTSAQGEADLRELSAAEIVGFMNYGDTVSVGYTNTPTYRAYRFRANAFDVVDGDVTSTEPGSAAWAALLGPDGKELVQTTGKVNGAAHIRHTIGNRFAQCLEEERLARCIVADSEFDVVEHEVS